MGDSRSFATKIGFTKYGHSTNKVAAIQHGLAKDGEKSNGLKIKTENASVLYRFIDKT